MACNSPFLKRVRDSEVSLPCGYCAGCRKDKLTMWSDRLMFELLGSPRRTGTFLTLTYDDEHLPVDGVSKEHCYKFLKDFRYAFDRRYGRSQDWNKNGEWHGCSQFKYVLTSEYGDIGFRPHYHGIFINCDAVQDYDLFRDCWRKGFIQTEVANAGNIRYVFKYITTEDTRLIYKTDDGMLLNDIFHLFSRGIGKDYIFQHANELRQKQGYQKGKYVRPLPPYYKQLLGINHTNRQPGTDWLKQYEEFSRHGLNVDDYSTFNALDCAIKNWYGQAKEASALSKENNGIKHFKTLKEI